MGFAFSEYTHDYNDKFPPLANVAGFRSAALTPYIGEHEIFHCPSTRGDALDSTDYFINARLEGADKIEIADPNTHISAIILGGDGAADQGPNTNLTQLPDAWRKDDSSPAHRHLGGANYLFADGHVKWFKPEKITLDKPRLGKPTFLIR